MNIKNKYWENLAPIFLLPSFEGGDREILFTIRLHFLYDLFIDKLPGLWYNIDTVREWNPPSRRKGEKKWKISSLQKN